MVFLYLLNYGMHYQRGTVTGAISTRATLTEQQLLSYMARLNYSFKDKYLLTVSARQDGSSVLAEGINIHGSLLLH